jgi:hypothetical protein
VTEEEEGEEEREEGEEGEEEREEGEKGEEEREEEDLVFVGQMLTL